MQQFLAPFGAWVQVIQGLVFIICVLMFRDGLVVQGQLALESIRRRIGRLSPIALEELPATGP
jgi:branched-chain amino acid transport system permease protein